MENDRWGFSQTRLFVIVVFAAIIFGVAGYWFGSRHPGGFAIGPSPVNNILNIDQESARDHPGSVTMNVNSGLEVYNNGYIGLTFQFPKGWVVQDMWPGDATDLLISGNTIQRQADIESGKLTSGDPAQFDISYNSNIGGLDAHNLKVKSLDEYIKNYSKEYTWPAGAVDPPAIKNPEKTKVGNLDGYKGEDSSGGRIYLVKASKGYFQITMRPDSGLTDEVQDTILTNLRFD